MATVKSKTGLELLSGEEPIIRFTLLGRTPLLLHSTGGMKAGGDDSLARKKNIPTPEAEAEAGAYRLPDGALAIPAVAVRNCLLNGAKGARIGKSAAKPIIAGAVLLREEFFPILTQEGKPLRDYIIDTQRAVVQKQGIMRSRPRIDPVWRVDATFTMNTDAEGRPLLNLAPIRDALVNGGRTVGIGDFRIEKSGWYGSFIVAEASLG